MDVSESEWSPLVAGRSFYSSYRWLASAEDHDDFTAEYLVARADGRVRAALPLYYAAAPPHNDAYHPRDAVYPALLAGSRTGYTNDGILAAPDAPPAAPAALLSAARRYLADGRAGSLSFLYLTPDARSAVRLPGEVPADPDTVLDLPGDGFEDYLAGLSSKRRGEVRREAAAFDRAGYRVEVEPLAGQADRLAPLLAAVQGKHGSSDSVERMRRYLASQERTLGAAALLFLCHAGDDIMGFSLFYEHGRRLYGRVAGFDYARVDRRAGAYFTMVFYAPIRHAYARGLRELRWGPGSYEAKLLRGARLEPRWSVTMRGPTTSYEECGV